jgi:hypothetical protein
VTGIEPRPEAGRAQAERGAARKPFLLRLDAATFAALRAWAADDLRSVNGQIEFLLRRSLRDADRLPGPRGRVTAGDNAGATNPG